MRFQCSKCRGVVAVENTDCGSMVQCGHCGAIVQVPQTRFSAGSVIADFIIIREIGRGGMGIVYLAHQITLDRPAAVKILSEKYANNAEFVTGFVKEARAAAKLNHPHIVQAYAVGEDDGLFYFAMENIDGETMKSVLKRAGRIPVDQALNIIQQIAEALNYAWTEQKLIHRDIKPDNIMLTTNGRAKLADLGLARVAGEIDSTETDEVMGTPQYISPEALTGAPLDCRSDIYSLGATFYHFITGRFPFEGKTAMEIAKKHLTDPVIPPRSIDPSIPENVSNIIVKMMAKNPVMRYQSAEELIDDLRNARHGKAISAADTKVHNMSNKTLKVKKNESAPKLTISDKNKAAEQQLDPTATKNMQKTAAHKYEIKKRQQEIAKRRNVFIACGIGLVLLLCIVGISLAVANKKKKEAEAAQPKLTPEQIAEIEHNKEVDAILKEFDEFVKMNPLKDKNFIQKVEDIRAKNLKPTDKTLSEKLDKMWQDALAADESIIDRERRMAIRHHNFVLREREDAANRKRYAAEMEEKKKQETALSEEAKKAREEQHKKDVEARAVELAANLTNEKEYRAFRLLVIAEKKNFAPAVREFETWKNILEGYVQNTEQPIVDAATPFLTWCNDILTKLKNIELIRKNTYDGNEVLKNTQISYAGDMYVISSVKKNIVTAKLLGGSKEIRFNFDKLAIKQRIILLKKAASEAGLNDFLYFYILLYEGNIDEAKRNADENESAQNEISYILTSYLRVALSRAKTQKEKDLIQSKYGKQPEYNEVVTNLEESSDETTWE